MFSHPWDYQMAVTVRLLWATLGYGFVVGLVVGAMAVDFLHARRRR